MSSAVTEVPAASTTDAVAHFETEFAFETDCWDTHEALAMDDPDFVLLDVRSPALFARGHVPGAVNLPHGKIVAAKMTRWAEGTLFVTYCAGPHCNGAARGALRLARLGRPVKIMAGGITGWIDEGFDLAIEAEAAQQSAQPAGPYRTRCVSFLELWPFEGWRVKVYGLSLHGGPPPSGLVEQAKEIARERLSQAFRDDARQHGLAVLTVHEGEHGDYVLVDWWSDNDILRHHNYGAPKGHGGRFMHQWPGPAACVWEMAITGFERAAWIEHILTPGRGPDIAAYLAAHLEGDV